MITINIENVNINVNSTHELESLKSWFTLLNDKEHIAEVGKKVESADTGEVTEESNNLIDVINSLPNTQISNIAKKYADELNGNKVAFPSNTNGIVDIKEDRVVKQNDGSVFFDKKDFDANGLYPIASDNDHLSHIYEDYPDVEIITDEYESAMQELVQRDNMRRALYTQSKSL